MSKNSTTNILSLDIADFERLDKSSTCLGKIELRPLEGQQKSFYGKAKVAIACEDEARGRYSVRLYSYDTPILDYDNLDNAVTILWGGWSATTAQHIQAFFGEYIPKKILNSLKVGDRYCATALREGRVLAPIAGLMLGY